MQLTWHGHSTWYVSIKDTTFLIDPFFTNPKTSLKPTDIDPPDYVLLTHGHADHIGDVGSFTDSTIVATPELTRYISDDYGIDSTIAMNIGGTIQVGSGYVTMQRADHTNGYSNTYSAGGDMPSGYLLSDSPPRDAAMGNGESFYHAGDTGLSVDMRDVIGHYLKPDAAALPIGDHYTMGPFQAAIAANWLGVKFAFPMHYDTFPPIQQDPSVFAEEVLSIGGDAQAVILEADVPFDLTKNLQSLQ